MTNEQREEIIKSLAYGMKPEDIADVEDLSVETVEQIYQDYAEDVGSFMQRGIMHEDN